MTILDKTFLENITNDIQDIYTFDQYKQFLKTDIQNILRAELISHIFAYNSNEDKACFLLYKYEDKYIFIHIFTGTCSECFDSNNYYKTHILNAIRSSYVSTSKEEIEHYYLKCLSNDCDYVQANNIYFVYPSVIY